MWTLVISSFFDTNLVFMSVHFFILNECAKKLEYMWASRDMYKLFIFTALLSSVWLLILNFSLFKISKNYEYLSWGYCSVYPITTCLVMGVRQHFYDK